MSPRVIALGLPLLLVVDAGGGGPRLGCGGGEALPPASDAPGMPVDLDAQYDRAVRAAADLVSSLRQMPEDRPRLQQHEAWLRKEISLLAQLATAPDRAAGVPRTTGDEASASAGSASAPAGPTAVATAPTPEDERVRQERATMRGPLSTPLPGELETGRTLSGSSGEEIREACREAIDELDALASELGNQEPDLEIMRAAVDRLHAHLEGLGAPASRRRSEEPPPPPPPPPDRP